MKERKPDWIEGAKKATKIRKVRNTVHFKLYIEEGKITRDICNDLYKDLESIIHNRWK